MADVGEWVIDANGDGYPDDVPARLFVDLPVDQAEQELWAALLDLAASIGVGTHALPMPLVVSSSDATLDGVEAVVVRGVADIPPVHRPSGASRESSPAAGLPVPCLTRFFTIDGALVDTDGDLLPDASRVAFDLPESLPVSLGVALANLAARLGLESGGATLPMARDGGARFRVRPGDGAAVVRATETGWVAEGDAGDLARLIARLAEFWPHITAPECGGVGAALAALRRWMAGDGPEPNVPGEIVREWEWTTEWEGVALLTGLRSELASRRGMDATGSHLALVGFASEPLDVRQRLAQRAREMLANEYPEVDVTVLSAFKVGLSWLREVVLPALEGEPVRRVRVTYQPLESEDENTLDLRIRWLQELFPGSELLATALDLPLDAIQIVEGVTANGATYHAEAYGPGGEQIHVWDLFVPTGTRPFVNQVEDSGAVTVVRGGWVSTEDGRLVNIAPMTTDLERFWEFWQSEVIPYLLDMVEAVGAYAANQPFFSELVAEVWISEPNESLGIREENDSAAEALAEDIYFTTLDAIELYGQRMTGEKLAAPGAVIPIVHVTPGEPPRARITLRAAPAKPCLSRPDLRVSAVRLERDDLAIEIEASVDGEREPTVARLRELAAMDLDSDSTIDATIRIGDASVTLRLPLPRPLASASSDGEPPMDENIWGDAVMGWSARLAEFPEITAWVEDHSYQGRPIPALALTAPTPGRLHSPMKAAIFKPTHLIIARHHANEISSTNAAFRLAWLCATDPHWRRYLDTVNVIILPYENPDGAALHITLASDPDARAWKHHPARYNALGFEYGEDHFNPDSPFGEARARTSIWRRWPADIVVDNHGVPSHEWVQPFAGFGSPPRFRVSYWIVQALLYGIARYVDDVEYPAHRRAVERLRAAVAAKVRDTDIGEWNRVYGESYRFWGQSRLPDRFPGEFHDDMLWHISSGPADPEGRGFATRYPGTTVLSWVTEVADETASGEHLDRVARAHLLANQATLDLLSASAPPLTHASVAHEDGTHTLRVGRARPLRVES